MPSTSPNPRASVSDELDTGDDEAPGPAADDERRRWPRRRPSPSRGRHRRARVPHRRGRRRHPVPGLRPAYSTTRHEGVTLKADLDPDAPSVQTWSRRLPRRRLERAGDLGDVRLRLRGPPQPGQALPAGRVRGLPPAQGLPPPVPRGEAVARPGRRRAHARGAGVRGRAPQPPPKPAAEAEPTPSPPPKPPRR